MITLLSKALFPIGNVGGAALLIAALTGLGWIKVRRRVTVAHPDQEKTTEMRWVKVKPSVHRLIAIIGILLGLLHAAIALYLKYGK